nr:immunoglobulin heavy chain junction region [Macaca mulatta]MOV47566.1 immunoglobulin heavy chain junction region [Macaca mulatta]MOV47603.1 immunoglobulin heavy chain junction region [Macaca mulatta]MOV47953.1 immunoglobulin heavy chain junction region [Macaca mulatta]MOV48936.1 immunoglobulin heavy chain junction region [Macaca mulatta]
CARADYGNFDYW